MDMQLPWPSNRSRTPQGHSATEQTSTAAELQCLALVIMDKLADYDPVVHDWIEHTLRVYGVERGIAALGTVQRAAQKATSESLVEVWLRAVMD